VSETVPPSAPGKAPGKALQAVRAKQWTTWPVASTIARWYARRPFLTTWGLLAAGMVVMMILFGHDAGLTFRQHASLGVITVGLAALCTSIIFLEHAEPPPSGEAE